MDAEDEELYPYLAWMRASTIAAMDTEDEELDAEDEELDPYLAWMRASNQT